MISEEHQMNNDVDSIMTKQTKNDTSYIDKFDEQSFSFLDLLSTESVYDFISDGSMISDKECGNALEKHKHKKPTVRPYVKINDLNNSKEEPYLNKPKPAIEIGIKFDF